MWSQTAPRQDPPAVSATLIDQDSLEWDATITHEPYGALKRITATLFCRTGAKMHASSAHQSITEAQEWCYKILGIE